MKKKGQITLFIIIGIIILVIIGLVIFMRGKIVEEKEKYRIEKQQQLISQSASITSFIQDCMEDIEKEALIQLGIQGGYINLSYDYFSVPTYNTTYLYFEGENRVPTLIQIEEQLSDYLVAEIEDCADLSIFKGVEIESANETYAETTIREKAIGFNLNWPMKVKLEDMEKDLKNFYISIPLEFMDVYRALENIINATVRNPNLIDHFFLLQQNVSFIDFLIHGNDVVIYLLMENKTKLDRQPYYFLFAVKIKEMVENNPPVIGPIPVLKGEEGELFTFKINASDPDNDSVSYDLNSPLFDIDSETGLISFTPTHLHRGEHLIRLMVTDGKGAMASQIIRFIMEGENIPPELIVENRTAIFNQTFAYTPYAFDVDDAILSYSLLEFPEYMAIDESSGLINWTPQQTGNFSVMVGVNDSINFIKKIFNIEVRG